MAKQFLGTRYQSFKNDGTVNAAGWVYFYEQGTSTEKTTYSDSDLGTPNASPVVLNSAGAADIWYDGDADVSVYDSTGTLIDPYSSINPATSSSTVESNLIANGSFEYGGSTTPSNWTRSTPPSLGTSVQDTDSAHGLYSWKFTSGGNGAGNLITTDFFNVAVGRTFNVVWQMKSSVADVRNLVEVVWYDDASVELSASSLYDNSTTNPTSWTVKSALATPVASAVRAKLRITGCHPSDSTTGSTWFDGFDVTTSVVASANNTLSGTNTFSGRLQSTQLYGTRYGQIWSNNAGDATNDIDITAGGCMDSTSAYWITTTALTKQSDVAWAVGTNAGMLDTGAVGNSDYYIWAIARSDTGVTDYLSSLSSTAPTMPANYDYKRLIGWFKRLAGAIVLMDVYETDGGGVEVAWRTPTLDVNLANTLTTSRRTDAVKVPLGFSVVANLSVHITDTTSGAYARIMCPDETDVAVINNNANLFSQTTTPDHQQMIVRTSSTGTIAARSSLATVDEYQVLTTGFMWARRN